MNNYYQTTSLTQPKKPSTIHKTDMGILKGKCCTVYIPLKFVAIMNLIHQNLENKNDEFTVFFKVEVDDEDPTVYYILDDKYIIPNQLVNSVHFTNKEDINFKKYNSCIHRHPQGVTKFSREDEEWLNDNVEVSVLFIPNSKNIFPHAIVNLPLANGKKYQVEAECIIDDSIFYEHDEINNVDILTEEGEDLLDSLSKYINEEYITEDINISIPENYTNKVIVDVPLNNGDSMTMKVEYDLFTKEERESIISDVKKYIKHDTSYDKPRFIQPSRQFGKTNRMDRFINDLKQNTLELNEERELSLYDLEDYKDPFYFDENPYMCK